MAKGNSYSRKTLGDAVLASPMATLIFGFVAIALGLLFVFVITGDTDPVSRAEAVAYEGEFEKYREGKNWSTIYFTDGSEYDLYPHTLKREVRERLESLDEGTKLYLMINPNTTYVAELRTENEELLNFETTQQEIDDYQIWYVGIGCFVVLVGLFLIVYALLDTRHKKKQEKKRTQRPVAKIPLRPAASGRARILLEAQKGEYNICYRRIKCTNELVINGEVYDEIKAVIEFKHSLCAIVDGNKIEAGYTADDHSYISFNGRRIAKKKRWI